MNRWLLVPAICLAVMTHAQADLADKLGRLVGYSVIHSGTVTGYQDDRKKPSDSFEGCEFGRRIFIDDRYAVTCATYSYTYSYRPSVAILSKNGSLKMVVGDEIYDITK